MEQRVLRLVAEVLEVTPESVAVTSKRSDFDAWDSMQHLTLMMAVQEEFGIELDFDRILAIGSVADIVAAVSEE